MKIVLKRSKHPNGVRPTRNGSLKVRMVEFCDPIWQAKGIYAYNLVELKNIERNEVPDTYKKKYDTLEKWRAAIARIHKKIARQSLGAYEFLLSNKQVSPADVVSGVIVGAAGQHLS